MINYEYVHGVLPVCLNNRISFKRPMAWIVNLNYFKEFLFLLINLDSITMKKNFYFELDSLLIKLKVFLQN